jgi:hypothetical protein
VEFGKRLAVVGILDNKFLKTINMKNRILVFLVFITTILNAQSVDPETFPAVVGEIGNKKLYTNTGGEGSLTVQRIIDSVKITDTVSMTYAQFYNTITNNNLQVGKTYILVDFQTVYDQMDFDSTGALKGSLTTKTGAVEQIWVYALSNNQIASKAYSATYPKDQIQYDWTYNATFVNGSPAKGRISERIDENNNRTDYDHREIKFIRYDDGNGNFVQINDSGRTSQEFLTFGNTYGTNTGEVISGNYIGDFYVYNADFGQEYSNNVFHANTFMALNKLGDINYNNTWGDGNISNTWGNNNISNTWGDGNSSNTWGNDNDGNTWGNNNISNTWGNHNDSNTWGNNNGSNTWGDNNDGNTWGDNNGLNTWGNHNDSNTFTTSTYLGYLIINSFLSNKTIDDITYPFLFNTLYKKEILKGSDNNDYIKTFDGTIDQYILIP